MAWSRYPWLGWGQEVLLVTNAFPSAAALGLLFSLPISSFLCCILSLSSCPPLNDVLPGFWINNLIQPSIPADPLSPAQILNFSPDVLLSDAHLCLADTSLDLGYLRLCFSLILCQPFLSSWIPSARSSYIIQHDSKNHIILKINDFRNWDVADCFKSV